MIPIDGRVRNEWASKRTTIQCKAVQGQNILSGLYGKRISFITYFAGAAVAFAACVDSSMCGTTFD